MFLLYAYTRQRSRGSSTQARFGGVVFANGSKGLLSTAVQHFTVNTWFCCVYHRVGCAMSAIKYRTSIEIQISRFRTMALCLDSPSVLGLKPSVSQYNHFIRKPNNRSTKEFVAPCLSLGPWCWLAPCGLPSFRFSGDHPAGHFGVA